MKTSPVEITTGNNGLPLVKVHTQWSTAEIYLHGAHVTHFQKHDEPPLIFLSRQSLFTADKAIRGGIPICFPWFGAREGSSGMHGFARLSGWEFTPYAPDFGGQVALTFTLPEKLLVQAGWPAAQVNYIVTVGETLTLELRVTNTSTQDFVFEDCLHTYFSVGDISQVSITGLKGIHYVDKVEQMARKQETGDSIRIQSEVDRVYLNTPGTVEIHDAKLGRTISVVKSGSASTVVWNPWINKARALSDFGDEEYQEMVCVESGNVGESKITLPPGQQGSLKAVLGSSPLK
jgi:glucose-6-phosphate 1-epimerase